MIPLVRSAIVAFGVATTAALPVMSQTDSSELNTAIEFIEAGMFDNGFEILIPMAVEGDTSAQLVLSMAYQMRDQEGDAKSSLEWMAKSAIGGSGDAFFGAMSMISSFSDEKFASTGLADLDPIVSEQYVYALAKIGAETTDDSTLKAIWDVMRVDGGPRNKLSQAQRDEAEKMAETCIATAFEECSPIDPLLPMR